MQETNKGLPGSGGMNRLNHIGEVHPRMARFDPETPFSESTTPSHLDQAIVPERVLVPLDHEECSLEVFSYINQLAKSQSITVILLHVVNLNILLPERRILDELSHAAYRELEKLAQRYLDASVSTQLRVRFGRPAQEIVTEARESKVDLILLTTRQSDSSWKRPFQSRIPEKVLKEVSCNTTVLRARTRLNCAEA